MRRELQFRSRQRIRRINLRQLRQIVETALTKLVKAEAYELCIHIVAEAEMTRLNETYLRHAGSTDVITFDHSEHGTRSRECPPHLYGEIFVCINEAITQAGRFRSSWQSEIVRYIAHGLLHLLGFDDKSPKSRRKMKVEEHRLMRLLSCRFTLSKL